MSSLRHPDLHPATQAAPTAVAQAGCEPLRPRARYPLAAMRAAGRWLVRLNARIEASWVGDAIGGACLCATFTNPVLLPAEIAALSPADLMSLAVEVAGFFVRPEDRAAAGLPIH